jgi:hypothetical protein
MRQQAFDMGNRRILKDTVPQIEDMRPIRERLKDSRCRLVERFAAGN